MIQRHWYRIFRIIVASIAALIIIVLLLRLRATLLPFLMAFLLAYLLAPVVDTFEARGLSRGWAILLIYVLLGIIVSAIVVWIIPDLLQELNRLAETLPAHIQSVEQLLLTAQERYSNLGLPEPVNQAIGNSLEDLERRLLDSIEGTVSLIVGLFNGLFSLALAPVLAFYLLKDAKTMKKRVMQLLPSQRRGRWTMLIIRMDRVLSGFIRGQLLLSVFVGVTTWLAMLIIGMRFSVILGLIAAITEVIPYFGPIIGALPAIGMAALISPLMLVKVVVAYVIIHEIESMVLGPKILGETVGLHPLTVVFALLAGGELFGIVGIILAVPVVACLKVLLAFLYDDFTAYRGPTGS